MKITELRFLLLICLLFSGCEGFTKAFQSQDTLTTQWNGSGIQRSVGVGTGIDPQAREIEGRLGYRNTGF